MKNENGSFLPRKVGNCRLIVSKYKREISKVKRVLLQCRK